MIIKTSFAMFVLAITHLISLSYQNDIASDFFKATDCSKEMDELSLLDHQSNKEKSKSEYRNVHPVQQSVAGTDYYKLFLDINM